MVAAVADVRGIRVRRALPAAVLMYHRIEHRDVDPLGLFVSPENFAAQIAALRGIADIVPAAEILEPGPRARVAITFDDGYADNLYNAEPTLAAFDAPGCIFATNQFSPDSAEFWWDQLDHLFLREPCATPFVAAPLPGRHVRFDVRNAAGRTRAFSFLNRAFRTLQPGEQQSCLEALHAQLGVSSVCCAEHARLTANELEKLAAGGLIEIGGHTATHRALSTTNAADAQTEIAGNRRALTAVTGRAPRLFAYPYGDSEQRNWSEVRAAGYTFAFSTKSERLGAVYRPFLMPRIFVGDWGASEFLARISGALAVPA